VIGSARHILVALHFVCPLIFFTNLTRNPYITQIALLNIGLLAAAVLAFIGQANKGEWQLTRTRLDAPIGAWILVCLCSWLYAYFGHAPYYRDAMRSEGLRVFLFTLINAVLVFFMAAASAKDCEDRPNISIGPWIGFCLIWGFLWTFYPQLRSQSGGGSLQANLFDPYGAFLWAGGVAAVIRLTRSGTVHAVWHVALAVGFLSSVYGIMQYFGMEFLWPKVLNPYGGRSVSTFGNPNFMSSYQVMMIPLAIVYYLTAKNRGHRVVYAAILLALEAGLFCSLTRSSWVGAVAAAVPLIFSKKIRRHASENMEFHGLLVSAMVMIAVFWPQSNIGGYTSSLFGRLGEIKHIFEENYPYSPWYQRVLIWMCAWTMGAENPILGKGFGLFELFYPFYQGHYLDLFDFFRNMRTHANNSHNEILEVWAQTGIAGLGVLFWTWVVFFRGLWRESRLSFGSKPPAQDEASDKEKKKNRRNENLEGEGEKVWLLAGGASVFGMLVDNLMNVSLHFAVPAFFFWWQAGTVAGHLPVSQDRVRRLRFPNKTASTAGALLVLTIGMFGAYYWLGYWNREVHYFNGFKFMRQGNFQGAIEVLRKAYSWNKLDVNNNYELGNAYARSEQPDMALWAYGEALKANTGYDEIYFNNATILVNQGRLQEALTSYKMSWAINPISHQLYASLSRFYLQDPSKYREECIKVLERGSHFFPEDLNFLNNLGYLYSLGKEYEKAEAVYDRLLRKNPFMAVAEKNLRTSLAQSGHLQPDILTHVAAFRRLEENLRAQRYGKDTLAIARKVSAWFPENLAAMLYLGNLEMMHGDPAKATEILSVVTLREPGNVAAQMNYGIALKQMGKFTEAAAAFRAVLAADPRNERARAEITAIAGRISP
jgi:tetratricopeptide (TPR) repeat protein/O-antigen ligase